MGKISNTVLTSRDQGLTGGQQKNARDNIGAMGRLSTWTDGDVVVSGENGEVVDSGVKLSAKADKSYVDTKVSNKADKNEVDAALAAKADKSTVEADHADPGGTGGMEFGGRLMAAPGLFQAGW